MKFPPSPIFLSRPIPATTDMYVIKNLLTIIVIEF